MDFEEPIVKLENKIKELKLIGSDDVVDIKDEIKRLEEKANKLKREIYSKLTAWQRVQVARHARRPYTLDYIDLVMKDFVELHGDRRFADDSAIVGGLASFEGRTVMVIGHQKGRNLNDNLRRNFGMPHPEGYRKALRLMKLASKFRKPLVIFIDTPGAYCGVGAEERGEAEAIAVNLCEMMKLPVPVVVVVIGEGASGGALGIGIGDRVYMMENAWYSVISPEACASIVWRDASKSEEAAEAMKLTASDLVDLKIIDGIIDEPLGGAHRDRVEAARLVGETVKKSLDELTQIPIQELLEMRYRKFRGIGVFAEEAGEA
jgi:acetyl-CoA carboxylase carboxyl transferase subunit alpha